MELSEFFAFWYKFRKAYFSEFWVTVVKNERGPLVHEALKSAASHECMYWAIFLHGDSDAIVFLSEWYPTLHLSLLNIGGPM